MLPWGHLAVGYLMYAALVRRSVGDRPDGSAVLVLAVGTQVADLVDKPLAWHLGFLEAGRSLGHSLLVAVVVLPVVLAVAVRYDRGELGVALAVGHLSHLLADAYLPVLAGEYAHLAFLVWPLADLPATATRTPPGGIVGFFLAIEATPPVLFELGLFLAAATLWLRQGTPGAATLRRVLDPRWPRGEPR